MTRTASIDIGTNTVLMLIADVAEDGTLTVIRDEHAIVRLGKDVDASRMIRSERVEKLTDQLLLYKNIAEIERCSRVVVTGTSALRDAANCSHVLSVVEAKTGLMIRVLSADEEAELTFAGGVSGFSPGELGDQTVVLDIGGGSTELVIGRGKLVQRRSSYDIGAVRMTERFWDGYPPDPSKIGECRATILNILRNAEKPSPQAVWIGVAGTVTTLAAVDLGVSGFDGPRIHGHNLSLDSIRNSERNLGTLRADQLAGHPSIHPDRADIIVAGILILDVILTWAGVGSIRVSTRGLRYGAALKEAIEPGSLSGPRRHPP